MKTSFMGSDVVQRIGARTYVPGDLDTWLATHGLNPPARVREVLSLCGSPPEILFALGFASLRGFHVAEPRVFRAEGCALRFQYPIGRYFADFLLEIPAAGRPTVIEIDGYEWHHSTPEIRAHHRERQSYIEGQRYRIRRIAAKEAETFGKRLWLALQLDLDEYHGRVF